MLWPASAAHPAPEESPAESPLRAEVPGTSPHRPRTPAGQTSLRPHHRHQSRQRRNRMADRSRRNPRSDPQSPRAQRPDHPAHRPHRDSGSFSHENPGDLRRIWFLHHPLRRPRRDAPRLRQIHRKRSRFRIHARPPKRISNDLHAGRQTISGPSHQRRRPLRRVSRLPPPRIIIHYLFAHGSARQ